MIRLELVLTEASWVNRKNLWNGGIKLKNIISLFWALILAFSLLGCGGGGSNNPSPSIYAGNWQGTWIIQETSEYGTKTTTISNTGSMTGKLTNSFGQSTSNFSGQVTGSNVSFTYQYAGGPKITASGVFGNIINNQVQITFTINYSGNTAHGTCSLTKQGGSPGPASTVYTAGSYFNGTKSVACYWKGTNRTDLPGGSGWANAESIYVSDGTVYTAGQYHDGTKEVACYWTGTNRTDLPGGTIPDTPGMVDYTVARSIFVSGGTVYTAGQYYDATKPLACYWTGTTRIDLPGGPGSLWSKAYAIYVYEGTVYTAGSYCDSTGTREIPCYWTETTRTDLPGGSSWINYAWSIYVSGGIVYTAGRYSDEHSHPVPCYWTGTTRTDLPIGSHVFSIYVSGETVYTSGSYYEGIFNSKACYWTGINRTDLPDGNIAQSIYISGGIVYTAGSYDDGTNEGACYWKGTNRTALPGGESSYATSIYVTDI